MRINKDYVVRRVAGETMLIPVGKSVIEHNGIFTLTESGAFIYDRLCEGKTRDEIVEAMKIEFDADEATIRSDADEFLRGLIEAGIVSE